jgi:hypothetical protein
MSLHFQIDIAFDLQSNRNDSVIEGLTRLTRNEKLTDEQKTVIPHIFRFISTDRITNSFYGRSIFYIDNHHRYTKDMIDVNKWTIHLREVFTDDIFYEEGYPLIAWFATLSETEGFVGYIKEEFANSPKLIYFKDGVVLFTEKDKEDIEFRLSDFDLKQTEWKD